MNLDPVTYVSVTYRLIRAVALHEALSEAFILARPLTHSLDQGWQPEAHE